MIEPMESNQKPGSLPSNEQRREEAVFDAALSLPAEERAAYLDKACSGDASLRQRIEVLLLSHKSAEEFLDMVHRDEIQGLESPLTKFR